MKMTLLHILAVSAALGFSVCSLGAESSAPVEWSHVGPLTPEQMTNLGNSAKNELLRIVTNVNEFATITGFYNDPPSAVDIVPPNARLTFVEKGGGTTYWMGFFVEGTKLKLFINDTLMTRLESEANAHTDAAQKKWDAMKPEERKGTFDDFAFPTLHKPSSMKKAPEVIKFLGNIDVTSPQWRLFRSTYESGTWLVEYILMYGQYEMPSYFVSVRLADNANLDLVKYQSNLLKIPTPRNLEAKISREKAREFSDVYLKKYYRKNEVGNLVFSTNRLYVAAPNYAFTPKFKNFATPPSEPPTLMWGAEYSRTGNTSFATTPVEIHIDAGDGAMLGGWE
jgi:hypothetical protein